MYFPSLTTWIAPVLALSAGLYNRQTSSGETKNLENCRCYPGDACWPTPAEWTTFNETVNGRLIATIPIGSVCHDKGFGEYSLDECERVKSIWHYPETHFESSSSIMAPFWANQSCDPFSDRDTACTAQSFVQYAVDVREISHYQKTLQFARDHNLRFVIRNTGHDYYGKSNGAGALAVWTHHLQNMEMKDWNSAEYTGKAVKVGAGVQVHDLWKFMQKHGYITPGGFCPTVGIAGGYSQGGGHGPLASAFGLGADQVLEWEVVDGTGKILRANQHENQDLYWALSGGGGGSYGIVWSMTSRAYKDLPTSGGSLIFTTQDTTEEKFYDVVDTFVANQPALTDAGIAALWYVRKGLFALVPMIGPGVSKRRMEELLRPTFDKLKATGISYQSKIEQFHNYLTAYDSVTPLANTSRIQIGGRLISRSVVENDMPGLGAVIRNLSSNGIPVSGVAINVNRQASIPDNAIHSGWRQALFSMVVGTDWSDTDWDLNIERQHLMTDVVMPQIDKLDPNGLAYLNEGDPFEPRWQELFYGENYEKLRDVKRKYDPEEMFYGYTAVGSDEWQQDSTGRLCKV